MFSFSFHFRLTGYPKCRNILKKKPLSVNINNNISKAMPMFMCKSYVNESYSDLPNVVFNYRIREIKHSYNGFNMYSDPEMN